MFEIRLEDMDSPRKMTQSVLQATELLGMYQAELARILHCHCADIGELANARKLLQPATSAWLQAEMFIDFFQTLYSAMQGDAVAMHHWLRAENSQLGGVPLLLMVDDLRIKDVLDCIKQQPSPVKPKGKSCQ